MTVKTVLFKTIVRNQSILVLAILAIILTVLGAMDFITSTSTYRNLDFNNRIDFVIQQKYNKIERETFPDLKFYGKILGTEQTAEVDISRGDYDKHSVGDTIHIFKHKSKKVYITEYEIENQKFISFFGNPISFVIIPTLIAFITAIITTTVLVKKY